MNLRQLTLNGFRALFFISITFTLNVQAINKYWAVHKSSCHIPSVKLYSADQQLT
jgi:hypothetical protein